MFSSVLIANRGEIACRIARTAHRLGMRTIAVYSDADASALHVRSCDEAHRLGPAPPLESYLAIDRLIAAALASGAQCVHPGYGFLAENAAFADALAAADITFVGPPASAIRAMGLKDAAKALMEKAGVPVVPGYHGERQEPRFLREKAYEIGYPVLIKPVAGGGGKGMRRVDRHADFEEALAAAQREATGAFGDGRVLVEKYVTTPRHIEIQVFADGLGNVVHLNERDCSLQRRHQKVIEEAPAPGMTPEVRSAMGRAAVQAARAVKYLGAGTVEFIADGAAGLRPDKFWFMEMNTRLQVEHPVTEAITGLDLVEWQFRVAAGERLPLTQAEIPLNGHAVEARLYAEDPERGFVPSTGRIAALEFPRAEDVRIDSGVDAGMEITPFYDPMLAKVIAHAVDRTTALDRLADALDQTVVAGPRTNAAFLAELARAPAFREGRFDTGFIDRHLAGPRTAPAAQDAAAIAAGITHWLDRERARIDRESGAVSASPWALADGFALTPAEGFSYPALADGARVTARVKSTAQGVAVALNGVAAAADASVIEDGKRLLILRRGRQTVLQPAVDAGGDQAGGDGTVKAPMHGKLLAVFVENGQTVEKGQRIAVLEAMKMEHTLVAPLSGTVAELGHEVGTQVAEGTRIAVVRPPDLPKPGATASDKPE